MQLPIHFLIFEGKPNNAVIALRTKGSIKKGEHYSLKLVSSRGLVGVVGDDQWLPMDMFAWFSVDQTIELAGSVTQLPANDNAKE